MQSKSRPRLTTILAERIALPLSYGPAFSHGTDGSRTRDRCTSDRIRGRASKTKPWHGRPARVFKFHSSGDKIEETTALRRPLLSPELLSCDSPGLSPGGQRFKM